MKHPAVTPEPHGVESRRTAQPAAGSSDGFFRFPISCFLFPFLLTACSATKSLPEGELLYRGAELTIQHPDSVPAKKLRTELEGLFAPAPNQRFLGLPLRLYAHHFFGGKKEKGLGAWLRRTLGELPVLYRADITRVVERQMADVSFNRGHFGVTVGSRVDTARRRATVHYEVRIAEPYRFREYRRAIADTAVAAALRDLPPTSLITAGAPYRLEQLEQERQRIARRLKERGFYFFDANHLKFLGDTVPGERRIDLTLVLKEDAPAEDLRPMTIGRVNVYPDFDFTRPAPARRLVSDSVEFAYDTLPVHPRTLLRAILPRPGERYDQSRHERTQQRLLSLPLFQFVNIRFQRRPGSDTLLDMHVRLTPRLLNTVEGAVGFSYKSTRFLGPEISLSYVNRNLLGGAELLRLSGNGNFNFPLDRRAGDYFEEIRLQGAVVRPGLLLPLRSDQRLAGAATTLELAFSRERVRYPIKPDTLGIDAVIALLRESGLTELAGRLEADSTYAPNVGLNELRLTFGYQWQLRQMITHTINPLRLRYQDGSFQDTGVQNLLRQGSALIGQSQSFFNLERMLIFQPEYIFLYDSRRRAGGRHNYFYRGRLSFAGSEVLAGNDEALSGRNLNSRYLQMENDFRYYLVSRQRHTLAARWIGNVSIPFGAAFILPFFDFYSVGGPTSVRAFGTREVGPGTEQPSTRSLDLLRGKGDIQLEASLEYRYQLSRYLELAAFVDAGNVWLFRAGGRPNAEFALNDFYRELAAGAGAGLRVTISGLVLRLDFAVPLAKPWLPAGDRWVAGDFRPGDPKWRRENLAFVLAFGYPF